MVNLQWLLANYEPNLEETPSRRWDFLFLMEQAEVYPREIKVWQKKETELLFSVVFNLILEPKSNKQFWTKLIIFWLQNGP